MDGPGIRAAHKGEKVDGPPGPIASTAYALADIQRIAVIVVQRDMQRWYVVNAQERSGRQRYDFQVLRRPYVSYRCSCVFTYFICS